MTRRISLLPMLVVLALLIGACGGAATETPANPASSGAAAPTTAPLAAATPVEPAATSAALESLTATVAPATTSLAAAATVVPPGAAMTTTAEAPMSTPIVPGTAAAPTAGASTGSTAGNVDCMGAKSGDTISMLYQWSGEEESKLNAILKPLVDACGITIRPESTRDQSLLDTRVKAGTPPDIAFWQQVTVAQYASLLKPLDSLGVHGENYSQSLKDLGTVNGKWLGLPVKTDIKTIIWYSPANFNALGYTVPKTWDELNTLVEKMVQDGTVPWSMGFESGDSTGWAGSDFIQDILLVQKGPQYVTDIISGTTPYNDAGVKDAYTIYGKWATNPKYTVGGAKGTLSTAFLDAIYNVFSDPPRAMMIRQSGFAGGAIKAKFPNLKYGTDYDFFEVPGAQGMQAGADWMMAFSDKPAVKALVAYLSSDAGAKQWAQVGFDLTPNLKGVGNYSDPSFQKKAELLNAAKAVTPDIGDSIPGGFAKAEWTGIVNYVNGQDLDQQLAAIAAAQKQALGK
jgi:alpha-glucoside transport system substrate-binding protein